MSELCQFYSKIGACRHGEKCSRKHTKPTRSSTILLTNMYHPEDMTTVGSTTATDTATDTDTTGAETTGSSTDTDPFTDFYKDIFVESTLITKSPIQTLTVCENGNNHLQGNVYIQFTSSDAAQQARDNFASRWYAGKPVYCDLSPVRDLSEASCRQHEEGVCDRGELCNFLHVRKVDPKVVKELQLSMWKYLTANNLV
jgi:splicing factor U2AF subunit